MKKLVFLLLGAALLTSCYYEQRRQGPQVTSVRGVRPFNRIEVRGVCDVKYEQGDTFAVRVVGRRERVNSVRTTFVGQTLFVDMDNRDKLMSIGRWRHAPVIYVTSPDLLSVRLLGAGDFEAPGTVDTDTLDVYLKGVGDVTFGHVVCDAFRGTVYGTGDMDIKRLTATQSDLLLQGVGDLDVNFRNCGTARCTLRGTGDIELSGTLRRLVKTVQSTGDIDTEKLTVGRP